MNAHVPQVDDTKPSTALYQIENKIIISRKAWYKEVAGVISAIAWLTIIGLNTWAIVLDIRLSNPIYLLVIYVIAVAASLARNIPSNIDIDKIKI
jgi:hypothetical protein